MTNRITRTLNTFPNSKWTRRLVPLSPIAAITGLVATEISFAQARFPVSLLEGQLAFDGQKLKGYYATLIDQGTFDIYVRTQFIDFGIIFGFALMGFILHTAMGRAYPDGSWGKRLNYTMAFILPFSSLMDALENTTSFFMLADPTGFPNWIAPVYSSFALLKLMASPIAMPGLLIAGIAFGVHKLRRRRAETPETKAA